MKVASVIHLGILVGSVCSPCGEAWAEASRRVRVRGSAHVDAHVARSEGRLVVSGDVVDDALRPLVGVRVDVTFAPAADPAAAIAWSEPPQGCSRPGPIPAASTGSLVVMTDDAGRFCARVVLPVARYSARIAAHGTDLVEGTALEITVDLARAPLTMRFAPERPTLLLDDDTASFQVVATTEDEGAVAPAAGLLLTASRVEPTPDGGAEARTLVARATTDASGSAEFVVETARLGPPGEGDLRISFDGNATIGATEQALHVLRRAHVSMAALDVRQGRLPPAFPEDGFAVRLAATLAKGGAWSPTGTVEAYLGANTLVGAAPVKDGAASVPVAFPAPEMPSANGQDREVLLTFRYVPDTPWLQATGDITAMQPIRPPSPWRKTPLAAAALVVVVWLLFSRMPPLRLKASMARTVAPSEAGRVVLVRASASPTGWTGHLSDAHDGYGIANASVSIERPGFDRTDVVEETTSDAAGDFFLRPVAVTPGDRLAVRASLHAPLRSLLPPSGQLTITLALRKRALLDRLAAWARRRPGASAGRDLTPGEVRSTAGADESVARWAEAVEQAAYSGAIVDERIHAEVDGLAPGGADDVDDARPRSL